MQNLDSIVSILFRLELNESIALVLICYFISWYMYIDNGSTLEEQFPDKVLIDLKI